MAGISEWFEVEETVEPTKKSGKSSSTPHVSLVTYACHICQLSFTRPSMLHKHLRESHSINIGRCMISCLESECHAEFSAVPFLRRHLEHHHGFYMVEEELTFNDIEDFYKWKAEVEQQEDTKYIQCLASKIQKSPLLTFYHYCQKGHYGEQLLDGVNKSPCTSMIFQKSNTTTGQVTATFYKGHYGHIQGTAMDRDLVPLDKKDVATIMARLKFNKTMRKLIKSSGVFATMTDRFKLLEVRGPKRITVSYADWDELKDPLSAAHNASAPAKKQTNTHATQKRKTEVVSSRMENGNIVRSYVPITEENDSHLPLPGERNVLNKGQKRSIAVDKSEVSNEREPIDKKTRLENILTRTLETVRQGGSSEVLNEMMPVAITLINLMDQ